MVKNTSFLSQELMLASALAAGGASARELVPRIRRWQAPLRFRGRGDVLLAKWQKDLLALLEEAAELGASSGALLREGARFVREDERRLMRLKSIEAQFALQGAIAVVAPWSVLGMVGGASLNGFIAVGACLQIVGLAGFVILLKRLRRADSGELVLLRDLAVQVWLRVRAGLSLHQALTRTMTGLTGAPRQVQLWRQWLSHPHNHELWHKDLGESQRLSEAFKVFLEQGAPVSEFLEQYLGYIEDERKTYWDDRLASAPTYIALLFCGAFAPSVFLILVGVMWTQIASLWT